MCGITGIIRLNGDAVSQAQDIYKMTNRIKHRGPDDEGYVLISAVKSSVLFGDDTPKADSASTIIPYYPKIYIKNAGSHLSTIALGHRRLSIIDLSPMGHQPMFCLDRYWIVFNGEVYNYIELREELEKKKYHFVSHTDTEVIVAAYDCWGPECLNKFNGMWAFIIYDNLKKRLFVSRDRFGIKPLYYYKDKDNLLFASEIKAILAHSEVDSAPNIKYCKEYLKTGPKEYIKETAFKNIFRFIHASYIETDFTDLKNNDIKETSFWKLTVNTANEPFNLQKAREYAICYRKLLSNAVKIRLRADVKIGSALSGGLDSSSITLLTNQHLEKQEQHDKLETFSNIYQSEGARYCDESEYINQLASFLNVKSNQIEPKIDEIPSEHKKMIYAMENPPSGPMMGGWYTFKLIARTDVKINLDGQGADEQLAGYLSFIWTYFSNLNINQLFSEFKACINLSGLNKRKLIMSVGFNILKRLIPRRILEYIANHLSNPYEEKVPLSVPLNEALHKSTVTNLINLIHFGDSQSMAHSIESRMPFMDYRLMEFLASIPGVYKIHSGWTKYIARLAMDKSLPDNIAWRKDKMGWPDPSEYWLKGPLKEWVCKEIETSVFLKTMQCPKYIRKEIENKRSLKLVIRMLNLSVWYKIFINNQL